MRRIAVTSSTQSYGRRISHFGPSNEYLSQYRRVLDYFDAVKIGLTATPALHMAQIFGAPVFTYGYRQAVVDGWLVDHLPPRRITTALAEAGIVFDAGEEVEIIDRQSGRGPGGQATGWSRSGPDPPYQGTSSRDAPR